MNQLYQEALNHYIAKKEEAISNLDVCFSQEVTVETKDKLLNEVCEWVKLLTSAESSIKHLTENFGG